MIVEAVLEAKQKKIRQSPVNSNRASDLGHPCLRYHVFNRTRWQEKSLHDVGLQMIFDMGSALEDVVLRELADAGIKVIEQQRAFSWPEYQITGHVDGHVLINGGPPYPLEIKTCSPFVFKAINTVEDLKRGKYLYLRKYPVQLTLYMLMNNVERGVFLFKDKVSGAMKEIWMDLDYQLGEEALKRAEAVNAHVAAGTEPDPAEYDEEMCGRCGYVHICTPERIGTEVEIDTGELASILDRLEELKPYVSEHRELDEQVKKAVEGREKILAGSWFVTGKWNSRKSFTVPESRYWSRKIIRAA